MNGQFVKQEIRISNKGEKILMSLTLKWETKRLVKNFLCGGGMVG